MSNQNNRINISEETQIDLPMTRQLMSIEKRDWNRIKKMTGQIDDAQNRWENCAWASISTAFAFFLTTFTMSGDIKTNFYILSASLFVIGVILLRVSISFSKRLSLSKSQVLEEMDEIEKNVRSDLAAGSTSRLEILSAEYGADGKFVNVAIKLNSLIQNDRVLKKVDNNLFDGNDPAPGVRKILKVNYRHLGMEKSITVVEGQELDIP